MGCLICVLMAAVLSAVICAGIGGLRSVLRCAVTVEAEGRFGVALSGGLSAYYGSDVKLLRSQQVLSTELLYSEWLQ